ncbi:hypothetical protein C8F01DRAFT_1262056 [Mycena amicta]|nr:hypothetical protein C8F01DRAFT_1262056 [Mycena amicta]
MPAFFYCIPLGVSWPMTQMARASNLSAAISGRLAHCGPAPTALAPPYRALMSKPSGTLQALVSLHWTLNGKITSDDPKRAIRNAPLTLH